MRSYCHNDVNFFTDSLDVAPNDAVVMQKFCMLMTFNDALPVFVYQK